MHHMFVGLSSEMESQRNFRAQKRRLFMFLISMLCSLTESLMNQEGITLLEFKTSLMDPNNNLQTWNSSSGLNPCNWAGIACNGDHKVTSVHLHGLYLSGSLSSKICELPVLTDLNISANFISGHIPDFAHCQNLEVLDLCTNRFHDKFPSKFSDMPSLRKLYLCENYIYGEIHPEIGNLTLLEELVIYSNNLTGRIPNSISKLKKLRIVRAGRNCFSGTVPVEISECESLQILGLAENRLEGSFPVELQRLENLTNLILRSNSFSGAIPAEIGNFSHLEVLALHDNSFTGHLPKELGKLAMLKRFYLYRNHLNGTIPWEIGNCSSATEIDFSENHLGGIIPRSLGRVSNLQLLHLFENLLHGSIPRELGELKHLRKLDLSINNLTGRIPLEFQNLEFLENIQLFDNHLEGTIPPLLGLKTNLSFLDMSRNNLIGSIPPKLCWSQKLSFLSLGSNKLSGNIPRGLKTCKSLEQMMLGDNLLTGTLSVELCKLQNLSALELYQNRFTGLLPPEIGNFSRLERFLLSNNYFFGHIPPEIGKLVRLVTFNVSSNRLSGGIPHELGDCIRLQRLDLSKNWFTGNLPDKLGMLVNLELLKLSDNRLNGEIPYTLGELVRLTDLQMGGNLFCGEIPIELGQLTALQISLNISHNALTGSIPGNLGDLQMLISLYLNDNQLSGEIPGSIGELMSLNVCNLSNNNLIGAVPNTPVFRRMEPSNFAGNPGLCKLDSSNCFPSPTPLTFSNSSWIKKASYREKVILICSAVVGLVSLVFIAGVSWMMKSHTKATVLVENQVKTNVLEEYHFPRKRYSFQDLVMGTEDFSESAIIGRGACGVVYKAVMTDGEVIAVKKLKSRGEGGSLENSFTAELSILGNICHRNIVKLYGYCHHQDRNLLLYEYMENGSLGEILRGNKETRMLLNWNDRYKIALGAAEGLCYLHHDCKPQIIHRDIKSNNILLDEMLEAHVGDFGLAKLIDLPYSKSMSAVAGSYGYIAPEYAYTMKVTEKSDIYSFGVVLLELITGSSPVQHIEQGGDLVSWVRKSVHEGVSFSHIFDKRLDPIPGSTIEEMSLVLKIALFCTNISPLNRPTMREVVAMLIDAKEATNNSLPSSTSETPLDQ
ncbi:PREDICTED: leucine-rich repeat receptor-like serine/threonine-protein kinase At1g17230 [Ipomoea nil]|uniref:leucine-rich repeat receptor-like serine/threonine-protein kinase At1g17230 n=1 Tax=Ipomoea nil TaxID=35883 RepID=UPI000901A6D6|nr:PREDICTED: leucine-rich repeat receptor-like serine/threonine-protein kinase At1g17230 [Ipomoea nil]